MKDYWRCKTIKYTVCPDSWVSNCTNIYAVTKDITANTYKNFIVSRTVPTADLDNNVMATIQDSMSKELEQIVDKYIMETI